MNFSQGHSGTKVQFESCLFAWGKTQNSQKWAKFMNFSFWPFLWFGLPGRLLNSVGLCLGHRKSHISELTRIRERSAIKYVIFLKFNSPTNFLVYVIFFCADMCTFFCVAFNAHAHSRCSTSSMQTVGNSLPTLGTQSHWQHGANYGARK